MFPPARPVSGVLAFAYVSVKDPALSVLRQFDSLPHRYAQLPDLNRASVDCFDIASPYVDALPASCPAYAFLFLADVPAQRPGVHHTLARSCSAAATPHLLALALQ